MREEFKELIISVIIGLALIPIVIGLEYIEARIKAKAYKDSGVIIESIGDKKWNQI